MQNSDPKFVFQFYFYSQIFSNSAYNNFRINEKLFAIFITIFFSQFQNLN